VNDNQLIAILAALIFYGRERAIVNEKHLEQTRMACIMEAESWLVLVMQHREPY